MKKILKYSIFIFIVFLGFNSNVLGVKTTKKNFCNGGGYEFPCDYMAMRCTYTSSEYEEYSVDIDNKGNARLVPFGLAKDEYKIVNWEQSDILSITGKKIYEETNQCPKYLFHSQQYYRDFYVSDSKTVSKTLEDKIGFVSSYELESVIINAYESEKKEEGNSKYPDVDNCAGFISENACNLGMTANNGNFGCAWNKEYGFCSPSGLAYLSCGEKGTATTDASTGDVQYYETNAYDIPVIIPKLTSYAITILKTATPVILIIMGMFQLIKAITSQNEDEMKKAKSSLIKKLIAAVMIFFMVSIVQFVIKKVADDSEQSSLTSCMTCFINNDCGKSMYYTDGYGKCYSVETKDLTDCPIVEY